MTDTLIAASPLQALCAVEWIKNNKNTFLIVRYTTNHNKKHIKSVLKNLEIKPDLEIETKSLIGIIKLISVAFFYAIKNKGKFFFGEFTRSRVNRILRRLLFFKDLFLLDDGWETVSYQLHYSDKKKLNLFSFFPLEDFKNEDQVFLKNNFNLLKGIETRTLLDDIFIGTDEETVGWMGGEEVYLNHLRRLIKNKKIDKLIYFPKSHRLGPQIDLLKKIESLPNIEIQSTDSLLELYFYEEGIRARNIYTHVSTAAFTLSYMGLADKVNFITSSRLLERKEVENFFNSSHFMLSYDLIDEKDLL